MDTNKLINDIKNSADIIPDEYDGSYELVRSIVGEYAKMDDLSETDYLDLNAVYHMAIGTWKQSIEKKKESVEKTHLSEASKAHLYEVLDKVWNNACMGMYEHKTDVADDGVHDFGGKPIVGMFGTGFYSFFKTSPSEVQRFLSMCADISGMEDSEEIYTRAESALSENIVGMNSGSLSVILHCLKPYVFPVINGNYVGETIFPILGVKLSKPKDIRKYIQNCRAIKTFAESVTGHKNYRVYDVFSLILGRYKNNTINQQKLQKAIDEYKKNFTKIREQEIYKWRAIKTFQDHFDLEAENFSEMLKEATENAGNLLTRGQFFARTMILHFAEHDPEYVRGMFRKLFDESAPLLERIASFKEEAEILYNTYKDSETKRTYQTDNSVSVYLFFRYPEKYYIYMSEKFADAAEYLEYGEISKHGASRRVEEYYDLANQVWEYIRNDNELAELNHSNLTPDCYPDLENHVLAEDIIYFIKHITPEEEVQYWPTYDEYPLDLTEEDWKEYIETVELPKHPQPMKMLKGMLELGGEASPKQLSDIYGGNPTRYVGCAVNLGRRAKKYFELEPCFDGDVERFFPIPFYGRHTEYEGKPVYSYKLRPELKEALLKMDLSAIDPKLKDIDAPDENARYWLYAPGENASKWDSCVEEGVMTIGWNEMGDLTQYSTREEIVNKMKDVYGPDGSYWMNSLAVWQFSHEIKQGDIIYVKKGRSRIIGRGIVTSEYYYEKERGDHPNVMDVNWTDVGEWPHPGLAQVKTLTEINKYSEYLEKLNAAIETGGAKYDQYTKGEFLKEVYISEDRYNELTGLLETKKNIILQGAPGVGKTFTARRLAWSIMGEKNDDRIKFIQFHQNYSYEDFIMGYKPDDHGSFSIREGVFYNFCLEAREDPKNLYFFIIDEINRGNLSKIFGELMMAIEAGYRGEKVRLAYRNEEEFDVPANVRLIGMMNTADRSLALIDYALRRRFSFISMDPGFETDGFKEYQESLHNDAFNRLITQVKLLNEDITNDESLGRGFCIGHSYFCGLKEENCTKERLMQIVKYDLMPTLEEYWFDNKDMVKKWRDILRNCFND